MYKRFIILVFFLLISNVFFAQINQNRKKLKITRVVNPPKIDAVFNDVAWQNVEVAENFVAMRPTNGEPEPKNLQTKVQVVYDDEAIYFAAKLFDDNPLKIPKEFSNRDDIGITDYFLITINPIDDGQNPFSFLVTAAGVQADAKVSNGIEDFTWSAVWESSVKITAEGWNVEMKIPYSAIRFENKKVQQWGINFHRSVQNKNAQYSWNHIDNYNGNWTQYDGLLTGINNIQPPTRLSLYPYASTTAVNFDGNTDFAHNLGMDVKYGITENFTLDATLIPDFSQTAFDNVTLNLGPFEQEFTEQRQFFTEGTELFSKGNLFYSRRIGDKPSVSRNELNAALTDDEEITSYDNEVQMLNAIKISGRTQKGLGIGIFNAITKKSEATIYNQQTKQSTQKVVEPFANYNVLVVDQQFNKNSSVALINTNVTRFGDFRDGNVTGLTYHIRTKDSKYFVDGSVKMSSVNEDNINTTGWSFDTSIAKNSGTWRGEIGYTFDDDRYDINDLGFQFRNNKKKIYGFLENRILKPTKHLNERMLTLWYDVHYLFAPSIYTGNTLGLNTFFMTKKRFAYGFNTSANIGKQYDYFAAFQPLSALKVFVLPQMVEFSPWISSDYRKKFAYDIRLAKAYYTNDSRDFYGLNFSPRYRFNNRMSIKYGFEYTKRNNDQGFVDQLNDDEIIFGKRDREVFQNSISGKYSFGATSSLSLTFRHYWETVNYLDQYYLLENDGNLKAYNYAGTDNINYNNWNLDVNYIWQFAPGSQLVAFYRNTIQPSTDFAPATISMVDNFNRLFKEKSIHTFSLRLVYFIDYIKIKKVLSL